MPTKKAPAKKPPRKTPAKKVAETVDVIATEAAKSPAVQERLDRIGMKVLANIEYVLEHGSEAQRDSITQRLFASLIAAKGKNTDGDADEEERAEFRRAVAEMGRAISE